MNERTKAAVIGGAIIGVLSIIPLVGSCCILWALAGGAVAVFMYLKNSNAPFTTGDGATLGAMAGGVGALIYLIIGLPMAMIMGVAQMQQALEQAGVRDFPLGGTALTIVGMIIVAVMLVIFGLLGGLIGAAIFGKNRPGAMPPPPPANFGTGM
ncbi:MAG: hypothetical protein ACRD9R_09790 [Pyrinomonadaceae bacterium]